MSTKQTLEQLLKELKEQYTEFRGNLSSDKFKALSGDEQWLMYKYELWLRTSIDDLENIMREPI